MINGKAEIICRRLVTISQEINNAAYTGFDYAERITELYNFCTSNLLTNSIIQEFPEETMDFSVDRFEKENYLTRVILTV